MFLAVLIRGEEVRLAARSAEDEGGIVLSNEQAELETYLAFPKKYPRSYSKANFEIFLLFRRGVRENEIFRILSKDGLRLGWMFPLQALQSNAHKCADDSNFLEFARIGFELLCDGVENVFQERPEHAEGKIYKLSDFYSDDTVVLVLSKQAIAEIGGFVLNQHLPYFARQGFYPLSTRNPKEGVVDGGAAGTNHEGPGQAELAAKSWKLQSISSDLKEEPFVETLLVDVLPYEDRPVLKFFFLYQLVELLLDKVLQDYHEKLTAEFASAQGKSSSDLKEILEGFTEKLSEKKRLNILVSDYTKGALDVALLYSSCNLFLRNVGVIGEDDKDIPNFAECLYKVRNVIFHNFRIVNPRALATLGPLANQLTYALLDLLIQFRMPPRMKAAAAAAAAAAPAPAPAAAAAAAAAANAAIVEKK